MIELKERLYEQDQMIKKAAKLFLEDCHKFDLLPKDLGREFLTFLGLPVKLIGLFRDEAFPHGNVYHHPFMIEYLNKDCPFGFQEDLPDNIKMICCTASVKTEMLFSEQENWLVMAHPNRLIRLMISFPHLYEKFVLKQDLGELTPIRDLPYAEKAIYCMFKFFGPMTDEEVRIKMNRRRCIFNEWLSAKQSTSARVALVKAGLMIRTSTKRFSSKGIRKTVWAIANVKKKKSH